MVHARFFDLARYTPYGATVPVLENGGWESVTGQFTPQFAGLINAMNGQDPFGNPLEVQPSKNNPEGRPSTAQKVLLGLYGGIEAGVPYLSTIRRLREGGATAYGDSTVVSPRTKPGTAHTSAINRTFNPIRPTYLNTGGGEEIVTRPRRRSRGTAAPSDPNAWMHEAVVPQATVTDDSWMR